ncbi:MAG: response regulator SirA [Candidatus Marinimicrobia bacterium]|uniref:uridine kinase family protein n=1 Tax=Desulfobacula sp. TaxID=2593537 RepID=UPI0019C29290|nr:response regulator SirA [Candidatus Neomarinimicrobiota bacterium]MBL6996701.1 response regulator SirA [Desulfobacula sp.]
MTTEAKITQIVKRDNQIVPFDREKITNAIYRAAASVGGHDRDVSENITENVISMLNECFHPTDKPSVEEVQNIIEKVLIEHGHARTAKAFILYREYRRRERESGGKGSSMDGRLPYRLMYKTLLWNIDHSCETIEKLNRIVRKGKLPELIVSTNKAYDESVQQAARMIASEQDHIRLIIVAGPSSSGKTTTTAKLARWLNEMGVETVPLNLDHYFFDLELHPRDEHGDYDFETPEALDITLINNHLKALVDGNTVKMPYYDFQHGKRHDNMNEVSVAPEQVILIDTLHGLYEPLTRGIDNQLKFKVYIETISQLRDNDGNFIRWTDIRLLRRIIRDHANRGYDPKQTIGHWHYVRSSELKHIIPFIKDANYVLNGALPYEFPFLKKYTNSYFPSFISEWKDDPKRVDAFIRAKRIYKMLDQIEQYDDESIIPGDSLLREFIGGSVYKLH